MFEVGEGKRYGESGFVSVAAWPEWDSGKILKKGEVGDLNGKIALKIKEIVKSETKKAFVYVMPFEVGKIDAEKIGADVGLDVVVFAVNDKDKVDPKGMARKSKPGFPAIYLE